MEIDFVTYGKPMKKRKGNIFASRILHIPDIEQKLTSPLKNVITGFDCSGVFNKLVFFLCPVVRID